MDTIRVIYRCEDGLWSAESPDVAGWYVVGDTYDEVRGLVLEGVGFALEVADADAPTVEHFVQAA